MTTKELAFATSTIWVVLAAILVMFMQAGFAFLEAGLTRMKNVGHIAAKNVLVLAIASIVYYVVGFGIAFGDGGNGLVGRLRLPAVRRRAADDRGGAVQLVRGDPGGRGLPLRGRLLRRLARDRLGRDGGTDAAVGLLRLRRRLHADLLARLALDLEPRRLAVREGHAGLRRLDRRPLPGRARRPRRGAAARAADRQVRARREAERDPGPQHGVHDARRDHPLVRLVRLQPGLDAQRRLRRRRLLRLRRAEHEPRGGGRRHRRGRHLVARDQEARPLDDAERRHRGARRDHRGVRVRGPLGRDRDRLRRRRDRRLRRPRSSSGSASTTRSARSPRTAWRASGARSRSASSRCRRSPRSSRPAAAASSTAAGCTSSASRRSASLAVGAFTFTASFGVLWLFKVTIGIRTERGGRDGRPRRLRARHVGLPRVLHPGSRRPSAWSPARSSCSASSSSSGSASTTPSARWLRTA